MSLRIARRGALSARRHLVVPARVTQVFEYIGNTYQQFVVPEGITELEVEAIGASGRASSSEGGKGAVVTANVPVMPGEIIRIHVGQEGQLANGDDTGGGWPGGGGSASDWYTGGGGGGYTDLRIGSPTNVAQVVVAGAGGGGAGGGAPSYRGGHGGTPNGEDGQGTAQAGKGATTSAGGAAGAAGVLSSTGHTAGARAQGGRSKMSGQSPCSGGGGGGYFGGGGSGGGAAEHSGGTGGGGGSSLIPAGGSATVRDVFGHGRVTISHDPVTESVPAALQTYRDAGPTTWGRVAYAAGKTHPRLRMIPNGFERFTFVVKGDIPIAANNASGLIAFQRNDAGWGRSTQIAFHVERNGEDSFRYHCVEWDSGGTFTQTASGWTSIGPKSNQPMMYQVQFVRNTTYMQLASGTTWLINRDTPSSGPLSNFMDDGSVRPYLGSGYVQSVQGGIQFRENPTVLDYFEVAHHNGGDIVEASMATKKSTVAAVDWNARKAALTA